MEKMENKECFPSFPPPLEIDQTDFHIPTVTTTTTR